MDRNSLRNFSCRIIGDLVVISFDSNKVFLSRGDAELLQVELVHHVHFGFGGLRVAGFPLSQDEVFILNEVMAEALSEGFAVAFGSNSVNEMND